MGEDIDAEAEALLAELTPKRRVRPRLAPPLAEVRPVTVDTDDGAVTAWRLGEGPAVLLVHGWNDDNCLWAPMIEACGRYGRAVVALDLPAHGFSESPRINVPIAGRALRAVAHRLGPIDAVVGHSFGCLATVWALSAGLDAPRAALIASPVNPDRARHLDKFAEHGVPPAIIERAKALAAERFIGDDAPYDVLAAVGAVGARGLIVHSADDEQCPIDDARRLIAQWPQAAAHLVDGLGHRLIAQDPQVLERIIDFIDGY